MAKTIGQLTQTTTIAGGDEFVIEQSGQTKRVAASVVRGGLVNADIDAAAAIALSKLATGALPSGITVASANLVDGTIATADVADAAITAPKLSGAQTGSAPIYGCRAWVNFDGNFTAVTGKSYSRTGTTVTVTSTAHGLETGNKLVIASATDTGLNTAANTASAEITKTGNDTFTFQTASTGTASGTLNYALGIRASGNVASVLKNTTGNYTVTFSTAMADANYCAQITTSGDGVDASFGYEGNSSATRNSATSSSLNVQITNRTAGAGADRASNNVTIFR